MLTLKEIQRMSRDEKVARLRGVTPDSIVMALLAYLPDTFLSDQERFHTAIQELRRKEEYRELLKDFEPVHAPIFEYSPLLARVLKRLQIARLLTTWSPDFKVFHVRPETRAAIIADVSKKFDAVQRATLAKIARELAEALSV